MVISKRTHNRRYREKKNGRSPIKGTHLNVCNPMTMHLIVQRKWLISKKKKKKYKTTEEKVDNLQKPSTKKR